MAKKKVSQQENHPKEVSKQEKPPETIADPSMKLASLKSLNALLLKETVERREQLNTLLKSKDNLESEITRSAIENQRLEAEKELFEDQTVAAEIEQSLTLVFVSSQISQQEERLRAHAEGKIRDDDKLEEAEMKMIQQQREVDQVSNDFRRYKDGVQKDLDLKQKKADRLRSVVVELEKSNAKTREEIKRLQMERDEVVEEKTEMERRYGDLKRETADAVKEKGKIEQAKTERDLEINKLQKAVDFLNADLSRERGAFDDVIHERELIRRNLDIQIMEVNGLKSKLLDLEKNNLLIQEELGQLRTERGGLVEERKERERTLESLARDKASTERSLMDSSQLIEDLKREMGEIVRDNKEMDQEKTKQAVKITELHKELDQLRTTISAMQKDEGGLRLKVSELGKRNAEVLQTQDHLRILFGESLEENKMTERRLKDCLNRIDDQGRKIQEVVQAKTEIEQVKIDQEIEVGKLRAIVCSLQKSCGEQVKTNIQLQSEASHYRGALESITLERDYVRKDLDSKNTDAASLRSEVLTLEKSVDKTYQELCQVKMELQGLIEEKSENKNRFELLMEDKVSLHRSLVEAQEGIEDLRAKTKSAKMYSEQAFLMLKNTAEIVLGAEDAEMDRKGEVGIDAEKIREEIRPFAAELESIKRVFKNREVKVEDMTRQLVFLKTSMLEAQKKRSFFWTWLYSATTIFAAASVYYVARGH